MFNKTYTYADIGLVPRESAHVSSRSEVNLDYPLFGTTVGLPVMNAPMATVASVALIEELVCAGGLGCLDRTNSIEQDVIRYNSLSSAAREVSFFSLGLENFAANIDSIMSQDDIYNFCLDVANGFHDRVISAIKAVKEHHPEVKIIAGNVASVEGYLALSEAGCDAVRVGIGGGAGCTTSIATGIGTGQASLIRELAHARTTNLAGFRPSTYIIADGGIKEVGDICKAYALGADFVMLGSMLAGTDESGGELVMVKDRPMKRFAGQASEFIKGSNHFVEGVSVLYPRKGPVAGILKQIDDGLRSCVSYMGGGELTDIHYLSDHYFCLLSPNARYERTPHSQEIR